LLERAQQLGVGTSKAMIDRQHDLLIITLAEILRVSCGCVHDLLRSISLADLALM
jgi:hypothetical protein